MTPTDYLTQALTQQQAHHQALGYCPLSFDEPGTRFVLRETAEAAVALAQADGEREAGRLHRYYALLARALRRPVSNPNQLTP